MAGFEKFGKVGYVSETKVAVFTKFLDEGRLSATRCTSCKTLYYPPRADCKNCLSDTVEWVLLSGRCRLITYTQVHFTPPSFRDDAPYTLALAQLEEGPLTFGPLSRDIRPEELHPGLELQLTLLKQPGGRVSYEFTKRHQNSTAR